jgi:hypothetical protein
MLEYVPKIDATVTVFVCQRKEVLHQATRRIQRSIRWCGCCLLKAVGHGPYRRGCEVPLNARTAAAGEFNPAETACFVLYAVKRGGVEGHRGPQNSPFAAAKLAEQRLRLELERVDHVKPHNWPNRKTAETCGAGGCC